MANGHGGQRDGSGRPAKPKAPDDPRYGLDGELTPLELMLATMRDPEQTLAARLKVAVAAAPYCHARLANIEAQVEGADLTINLISYLDAELAKPDAEAVSTARVAGNGAGR